MTNRGSPASAEPYSPQRRTAIVFTGIGTAGAYHAGVLRALDEAGVKLDVVAGRGIGVVAALFAAVDSAHRLWDENGFWRAPSVRRLYPWHPVLRVVAWASAAAVMTVVVPLAAMAAGLVVYPIDFVLKMLGVSAAQGLAGAYLRMSQAAFAPEGLPTWLPRLALLALGFAAAVAFLSTELSRGQRRVRGPYWCRMIRGPISAAPTVDRCFGVMWDLVRGAAHLSPPDPAELGRRYVERLAENLGQPGFRELLLVAHDLDARRDLVFALVGESRRRHLVLRSTPEEAEARRAELFDLSGVARDHLVDAVAGALSLPLATDPRRITFAADAYWRGETHRLCDRPASLARLLEEVDGLDVQQILLVSAASVAADPHTLAPPRLDGRGRLGDYVQASEAALVRDLARDRADRRRMFTIQPAHNPIGPFDFSGGFDDRSDRPQPLSELMARGYEDAYHQFIEPVVGASGERVGQSAV